MKTQSTIDKAREVNLDQMYYGTFAEIGAGQEVARQFFQAGKASQTIALTISAYDMTYSDIIYGKEKSGRYVCDSRLQHMLDKEYNKLIDRLKKERGAKTCFFAFADTVSTSNKNSHGWLGVKFQNKIDSESSEVRLHVRLLDKHRLLQQEGLGNLGVNLIHCCFYKKNSEEFLDSLFDQMKSGSISVDAIHFKGSAFKNFNELSFNLSLIQKGWSDAVFINADKTIQNPADALWGKNILIQRAYYKPVTVTHLNILEKGVEHFSKEFKVKKQEVTAILEFTINNRIKDETISIAEALQKIEMIAALGLPVMVSRFALFYELKEFLRLTTNNPVAIVIGATHLEKLFDPQFYFDLAGGLLEGMGKLLDQKTRLYIYPHKTKDICLMTKSFFPAPEIQYIYKHFIENKFVQDIAGCDEIEEFLHSEDILKMIKTKKGNWKTSVPVQIHLMVQKMFKI